MRDVCVAQLRRLSPVVDDGALALLSPGAGAEVLRGGRRPVAASRLYGAHAGPAGATVLVPLRDRDLLRQVLRGRPYGPRALAVRSLRALVPAPTVTVRGPGSLVPAVVAAAAPDRPQGRCCLVVGGGGPRRRGAFLVAPDGAGSADRVVKAARARGQDRGALEQDVLGRVAALAPDLAPRGLGSGEDTGWSWSSETLVPGRPLSEIVTDVSVQGRARTRVVLEDLASRLGDLAAGSRSTTGGDHPVVLRGPHRRLDALLGGLAGVPRVLVHGDLATAHNVLVEHRTPRLIDWETARPDGLPLMDLLPVLCLTSARTAGHLSAPAQAEHVLQMCAGHAPESRWLLRLVAEYCRRAGVPLEAAGALALLGWGHTASMPAVHAELAAAAGEHVDGWGTPAAVVAEGWAARPHLGRDWSALRTVVGRS